MLFSLRCAATSSTMILVCWSALKILGLVMKTNVKSVSVIKSCKLLTFTLPLCSPECEELNVADGTFTYTDNRYIGSTATLTCIQTHEPVNSPATCVDPGVWSPPIPSCEREFSIYFMNIACVSPSIQLSGAHL